MTCPHWDAENEYTDDLITRRCFDCNRVWTAPRCAGVGRFNQRCGRAAPEGRDFCKHHDEEAEARRELMRAARRGAQLDELAEALAAEPIIAKHVFDALREHGELRQMELLTIVMPEPRSGDSTILRAMEAAEMVDVRRERHPSGSVRAVYYRLKEGEGAI